jgi:hypothetical protein
VHFEAEGWDNGKGKETEGAEKRELENPDTVVALHVPVALLSDLEPR